MDGSIACNVFGLGDVAVPERSIEVQNLKINNNMSNEDQNGNIAKPVLPAVISHLCDAIEKANVKITFGLQTHHIEHIEAELQRWKDMPPTSDGEKADPKYIKYVWEKLGKELAWCPFTLALYYFEHLEECRAV